MRVTQVFRVGAGAALIMASPTAAVAQHEGHTMAAPATATAVLAPTAGHAARGTVTFTRVADGVRITAQLEGLPAGSHGFHVHEFGNCSAADGTSAGGHFNPAGAPHGSPEATSRHIGDLGNVTADTQGMATYDRTDALVRLDGPHSVIGRAVIVHAGADDLSTQPTGNAGARLACGVVGAGK